MVTSSIDRIVGANLSAARRGAGLSREALAQASGLETEMIGRSELGEHRLTAQELWAVCWVLKEPVTVLLHGLTGVDGGKPRRRQAFARHEPLYDLLPVRRRPS